MIIILIPLHGRSLQSIATFDSNVDIYFGRPCVHVLPSHSEKIFSEYGGIGGVHIGVWTFENPVKNGVDPERNESLSALLGLTIMTHARRNIEQIRLTFSFNFLFFF